MMAGLVLLRQRPSTAKGITFVTLEDETGFANLIIRPDIWEHFHQAARRARVMLAGGKVQREGDILHLLVDQLQDISTWLTEVDPHSRNFR